MRSKRRFWAAKTYSMGERARARRVLPRAMWRRMGPGLGALVRWEKTCLP
ncbi:MAG: hypothetical protein U1E42_09705 [Rhodospirillales bacterium]